MLEQLKEKIYKLFGEQYLECEYCDNHRRSSMTDFFKKKCFRCKGCGVVENKKKIGIAEVLRVLDGIDFDAVYGIGANGIFNYKEIDRGKKTPLEGDLGFGWNLEKDNIDNQSEDTIKWLNSIIK